jgi:hypothetical protein
MRILGKNTLTRRTLLRGTANGAAVAIALPSLEAMLNTNGTAYAQGTALPKRFGIFWWGNGVRQNFWMPDAEGTAWVPKESLAPLAGSKEYVSVLTNFRAPVPGATAHHSGRSMVLTGTEERNHIYGPSLLPSVDQLIAKQWDKLTRYKSIEILVSRRGMIDSLNTGQVSQPGTGGFSPGEWSPQALFDRLFGGSTLPTAPTVPGTPTAPVSDIPRKMGLARQSVLDGVKADMTRLNNRVGANDKVRLAQHLDGIRALETQIQKTTPAAGGGAVPGPLPSLMCGKPTRPGTFSTNRGREDLQEVATVMSDLIAMALVCDITRVFTFEFTQMQSDTVFWQANLNEGMHTITHRSNQMAYDQCQIATVFVMKQLAYLVEKLKSMKEGAGNLLDSMCLYGTSEISEGAKHSTNNIPLLVSGKAGGALKAGQHYKTKTNETYTKLLLAMCAAMGTPQASIGSGATVETQPLTAILA